MEKIKSILKIFGIIFFLIIGPITIVSIVTFSFFGYGTLIAINNEKK